MLTAGLNDFPFVDANTYSTHSSLALDDGTQLLITKTFGNIDGPPYYPRLQVYNITPGHEEIMYSIGPIASDLRPSNAYSYGAHMSIDGRLLLVGDIEAFAEAPDARSDEGAVFLYRLDHDEATRLATIRKPAEAADAHFFGHSLLLLANSEGTEASIIIKGRYDKIYSFYWNSTAGFELRGSVRSRFDQALQNAMVVDRTTHLIAVTMLSPVRKVDIFYCTPHAVLEFRQELSPPGPFRPDQFGVAAAFADGILAVCAETEKVHGVERSGAIYVYRISSDGRQSEILQRLTIPLENSLLLGHDLALWRGRLLTSQNVGTNINYYTFDTVHAGASTSLCMSSLVTVDAVESPNGLALGGRVAAINNHGTSNTPRYSNNYILHCNETVAVAIPPPPPSPPACACAVEVRAGITWPASSCGTLVSLLCPLGSGIPSSHA